MGAKRRVSMAEQSRAIFAALPCVFVSMARSNISTFSYLSFPQFFDHEWAYITFYKFLSFPDLILPSEPELESMIKDIKTPLVSTCSVPDMRPRKADPSECSVRHPD